MFIPIAFKPGDKVVVKEADFEAVVNKVIIDRGGVMYQIQWWVEKDFRVADFFESELLSIEEHEKIEVGVIK